MTHTVFAVVILAICVLSTLVNGTDFFMGGMILVTGIVCIIAGIVIWLIGRKVE